jgi:hypothetical protein
VFVVNAKTVIVKLSQKRTAGNGLLLLGLYVEKIPYMAGIYLIILVTARGITVRDKKDVQYLKYA